MKKSMIEWILETTEDKAVNNRMHIQKKANMYERLHHKIDDVLKYCKSCGRVWQKNRKMMTREWEYYPKNYIPIIGKKRELCPNCKDNK